MTTMKDTDTMIKVEWHWLIFEDYNFLMKIVWSGTRAEMVRAQRALDGEQPTCSVWTFVPSMPSCNNQIFIRLLNTFRDLTLKKGVVCMVVTDVATNYICNVWLTSCRILSTIKYYFQRNCKNKLSLGDYH